MATFNQPRLYGWRNDPCCLRYRDLNVIPMPIGIPMQEIAGQLVAHRPVMKRFLRVDPLVVAFKIGGANIRERLPCVV